MLALLACFTVFGARQAAAMSVGQEHGGHTGVVGESSSQPHVAGEHGAGEHGAGEHADPGADGVFLYLYSHMVPHKTIRGSFGGFDISFYNINVIQLIAIVLIALVFLHVRSSLLAAAQGRPMGPVARVFSGFVMFVRDEMVMPILGKEDGEQYLGYFLFLFFFIVFMNLLGLVPWSYTPTACIFVTLALALLTLVQMIWGGIQTQGVLGFWKGLLPPGLPPLLVPMMFVVELIGLIVKPMALTIRLFANMLAGHLVVLSFMALIFYFAYSLKNGAYAVAVPAVGLSVFIMIIEGFVALLQAYIFTYLSILFVGMCRHPDH